MASDCASSRGSATPMHPVYAALTPITATDSPFGELSGVSLRVTLSARDDAARRAATATGGFLFTHHGYSGPSVLDVSHVVVRSRAESPDAARLTVQWTELGAAEWEDALRPQGNRTVTGALRAVLPDRLAAVLLTLANVDATRSLAELRREERIRLIEMLVAGELPWTGDEGYHKAEVTGGGVSLGGGACAHDGEQTASGTLHLRRGARRVRSGGRLQLLLGVGDGARGGARSGGWQCGTLGIRGPAEVRKRNQPGGGADLRRLAMR